MNILFVQKRAHRAGAQTCLARLLRHEVMRAWHPVLICSQSGWLAEECSNHGIPTIIETFPSSRSLAARLFQNGLFARRTRTRLERLDLKPAIVHANDHLEGLLGLKLARELRAHSAIFLRSPGMTRGDYFKYQCHKYDLIAAVGDELRARVKKWDSSRDIQLIHDGICENEFAPPRPKSAAFPRKILVIGSPLDWKGWADLTEALIQLESEKILPAVEFDFTGSRPNPTENNLKLEKTAAVRCHFLGRVEKFRELISGYDLVINPSRMESFGMAAMEVVALGVPLLSSRTGIIEQVIEQPEFLFSPKQPAELARALRNLIQNWPRLDFDAEQCQRRIREKFMIGRAVEKLGAAYEALLRQNGKPVSRPPEIQ
jgi:glycosyltransferase involved in cell wall biosynthesis